MYSEDKEVTAQGESSEPLHWYRIDVADLPLCPSRESHPSPPAQGSAIHLGMEITLLGPRRAPAHSKGRKGSSCSQYGFIIWNCQNLLQKTRTSLPHLTLQFDADPAGLSQFQVFCNSLILCLHEHTHASWRSAHQALQVHPYAFM